MRRGTRDAAVAALVAAVAGLVALAITFDRPQAAREPAFPTPSATATAAEGKTAWCAPQRANVDTTTMVLAAHPSATGELMARFRPLRDPAGVTAVTVAPGAASSQAIEPAARSVEVAWAAGPHATSQVATFPRGPAGTVAGPCPTLLHTDVVVPALTTVDGGSATVALVNPSDRQVLVDMEILTPEGTERPEYGQNVPVQAGATSVLFADDVAPDREVLAVRIRHDRGEVAVVGMQRMPATAGVQGRSWVVAPAAPATTWHLPWVASAGDTAAGLAPTPDATAGGPATGAGAEAWLGITNPGDEPAGFAVELLTESGSVPLESAPTPVPAGSSIRVDLGSVLAELDGEVGATVTATDDLALVVGAGATAIAGDRVERTGIATLTAHPEPRPRWVLSGPAGAGRRHVVALANPTSRPATVAVTVASDDGASAGPDPVTVAPGSTLAVPIDDPGDAETVTLFVESTDGQVVADLRSGLAGPGPLDLVAVHGTPTG